MTLWPDRLPNLHQL
jgi:cation/acetate symporter